MRPIVAAGLLLLLLLGIVWMGQGIGLIGGSFMTGRIEWSVIGSIVSGVAAVGLRFVLRPRAR